MTTNITNIMAYTKPPGLKYTTMCIYIDEHIKKWYNGEKLTEEEEETIYKYLYLLYYNVACREHYFPRLEDFNDYALWCATKAFLRLIDPRQFTGKLEPVKSILNYMKATSYGWKLKWQNETFQTVFSEEYNKNFDATSFKDNYLNNIKTLNRDNLVRDIEDDINSIPEVVKAVVNATPYRNDSLMCKRLTQSVLLSLLVESDYAASCKNVLKYAYKYDNIIRLWHLDTAMTDVVRVLLNRVKIRLADDVRYTLRKFDLANEISDEILFSNVVQKEDEYCA